MDVALANRFRGLEPALVGYGQHCDVQYNGQGASVNIMKRFEGDLEAMMEAFGECPKGQIAWKMRDSLRESLLLERIQFR